MATVIKCYYTQACLFYVNKTFHSGDLTGKYNYFVELFNRKDVSRNTFKKYLVRFTEYVRRNKCNIDKEDILNNYSPTKWKDLSLVEKSLHSVLHHCQTCDPITAPKVSKNKFLLKLKSRPYQSIKPIGCLTCGLIRN